MRYTVASTAVFAAAVVASPVAQGVTQQIKPDSPAPAGCSANYDGKFQIQVTNVSTTSTKRSLTKVCFSRYRSFDVHHHHMLTITTEAAERRHNA
jgi:hypothetical protein